MTTCTSLSKEPPNIDCTFHSPICNFYIIKRPSNVNAFALVPRCSDISDFPLYTFMFSYLSHSRLSTLPGLKSRLEHVRKLPVTWDSVVVFTRYSSTLYSFSQSCLSTLLGLKSKDGISEEVASDLLPVTWG